VLRVGTLNVRHTTDRWRARSGLLVAELDELAPDVIGMQELRRFPSQAARIARRSAVPYEVVVAGKSGLKWPWEGIAVLTSMAVVGTERLDLGGEGRVAQRVTVAADGTRVDFYNTHLAEGDETLRVRQARRLLAWMSERPDVPQVLVGDLNAGPQARSVRVLTSRWMRSAYAAVHGREPDRTVPTALRAGADLSKGRVIDYVLVNDRIHVHEAWIAFDRVDESSGAALAASDHLGIGAVISVRSAPLATRRAG
jgi:endonuclease/exonuclease/phosphatase family metal-dependent hydrolase